MNIVWAPRAIHQLVQLRAHIARDRPEAASRIAERLLTGAQRLADLPNLGRPGRISGTREFIVPGTPYLIAYRTKADRIEIIGVFHGRQKWPDNL